MFRVVCTPVQNSMVHCCANSHGQTIGVGMAGCDGDREGETRSKEPRVTNSAWSP